MTTVSDAERQRQRRARMSTPEPAADLSWQADGACRTKPLKWWFPPSAPPGWVDTQLTAGAAAIAICAGCPVRRACLDYALAPRGTAVVGIWGGTTERQRRNMRKSRRTNPPPIVFPKAEGADAAVVARAIDVAARLCGADPMAVMERRDGNDKASVNARHVAAAAGRSLTGLSWPALGRLFNRDHTTLIAGARRVHGSADLRALVEQVVAELAADTGRVTA